MRLITACSRWGQGSLGVAVAVFLSGCPQLPEGTGSGGSEGPPPEEPSPVPSSICDPLGPEGADETADGEGLVDEACPEVTGDAIRVEWYPDVVIKRYARSSVFFNTKNLLREQVEVEYQATARMVDRDEVFDLRLRRHQRTYGPIGGGSTEMDLQLGVNLNVLTEGEIEIKVSARLLEPVRTPMVEMSRVVVTTKHDEDGYIYDIDYLEW